MLDDAHSSFAVLAVPQGRRGESKDFGDVEAVEKALELLQHLHGLGYPLRGHDPVMDIGRQPHPVLLLHQEFNPVSLNEIDSHADSVGAYVNDTVKHFLPL